MTRCLPTDRRLMNLGFNAGWDAHESYVAGLTRPEQNAAESERDRLADVIQARYQEAVRQIDTRNDDADYRSGVADGLDVALQLLRPGATS